ncbi:MAG: hypothetical protein C7B46_19270 [Sulfobacillus benefaciens]|uniref:Integrase n=1 Tax=Sulfobacillus benefaciens TaxID=453960 RepID=A0A2T2WZZ5_9FIRM|nr:MAG: hypothetical protein C7B46_19270 [Sulfobacillus benefaciens]
MFETFSDLTEALEKELERLHYTLETRRYYRRVWRHIATFLEEQGAMQFTEGLGLRFLEARYDYPVLEETGQLTQSIINIGRVVRMLGDFQQHGSILRRYYKQRQLLQTSLFDAVLEAYSHACRERYSRVTQDHYRKSAEKFLSFLESQKITDVTQITARHCRTYLDTWMGYQPKTVEQQLCGLRSFLRYVYQSGQHDRDLSSTLPSVRVARQARIPSAWTPDQVKQVLDVIDRGNPTGKRDYAMILLVARLGLRSMDVKHLQLEHLHWADNRIEFVASKTGQLLTLPLLPDVGWAIIDYLKHGRPQVDSPYVFLRHLAPLEPFGDDDHLHQVLEKYRHMAHVPLPPQRKRGFHALRHTLATALLCQDTALPVIAEVLGHADVDSTAIYLKVDVDHLRACAVDPEAVLHP